ncbi:MAG: prealbumin-like fold domain-containing protein [Eubacteriales bacterium]|nr:prealbumin-like fold domain-containing protein [Eubacteriales bacterium]
MFRSLDQQNLKNIPILLKSLSLIILLMLLCYLPQEVEALTIRHEPVRNEKFFVRVNMPDYVEEKGPGSYSERVASFYLNSHYPTQYPSLTCFCIEPFIAIDAGEVTYNSQDLASYLQEYYGYSPDAAQRKARDLAEVSYFALGAIPASQRTLEDQFTCQLLLWEELGYEVHLADPYWYKLGKEKMRQRRGEYYQRHSLEGETIELEPGGQLSLQDSGWANLLPAAGFSPGNPKALDEEGQLSLTWNGADQVVLEASRDFQTDTNVSIVAGSSNHNVGAYVAASSQSVVEVCSRAPLKQLNFSVVSKEAPSSSFKLQKMAEQIVSWEEVDKIRVNEKEESVYRPLREVRPLAGVNFSLTLKEELWFKGEHYEPDDLVYEFTTDANGEAILEEIPCGNYLLTEESQDLNYLPLNSISIEIVPDEISVDEAEPYIVNNERRAFAFSAIKQLEGAKDLSYDEVSSVLRELKFVLRTQEDLPGLEEKLPAGSLVACSSLEPLEPLLPQADPAQGQSESEDGNTLASSDQQEVLSFADMFPAKDILRKISFDLPCLATFSLEEVNPGNIYQRLEPIELDFKNFSEPEVDAWGGYRYTLMAPLVNKLVPPEEVVEDPQPVTPAPIPVEEPEATDPPVVYFPTNLEQTILPTQNVEAPDFLTQVKNLPATGSAESNKLAAIGLALGTLILSGINKIN